MVHNQNHKLALDVRSTSFVIFRKDTFEAVSSGNLCNFKSYDDMFDEAEKRFKQLSKGLLS